MTNEYPQLSDQFVDMAFITLGGEMRFPFWYSSLAILSCERATI